MSQLKQPPSTIPLRRYINFAEYGVGEFEDSQSAIARPYRLLFEKGTDPGSMAYLLIHSASSGQYTALGTLCETIGQRLLFFPGCRARRLNSVFKRRSPPAVQALDGIVDHMTFEIRNRTCHVTEVLSNGKRRIPAGLKLPPPREVRPALYAWFGITLSSVAVLDRVPGKFWFSAECPASDVDRRLALFCKANKALGISTLSITQTTQGTFLQINFFVDFDPGQMRKNVPALLPNGPPELQKAIEIPSTMTAQLYGLILHEGVGIRIQPIVCTGELAHEDGVALGFY